jgi:hypothetical protein
MATSPEKAPVITGQGWRCLITTPSFNYIGKGLSHGEKWLKWYPF